jgi:hypothetical protein
MSMSRNGPAGFPTAIIQAADDLQAVMLELRDRNVHTGIIDGHLCIFKRAAMPETACQSRRSRMQPQFTA